MARLSRSGDVESRLTLFLAPQSEHHGQCKPASQQDGRVAGRVTEVSVDDIGLMVACDSPHGEKRDQRHEQTIGPFQNAGYAKKARSMHDDSIHRLALQRHRSKVRAKPSNQLLARKPRLRSNDNNWQVFPNAEHPLANEQPGVRLDCAGKQRREHQQTWSCHNHSHRHLRRDHA